VSDRAADDSSGGNYTAHAVAQILKSDPTWLVNQSSTKSIVDTMEFDGELEVLRISIHLYQSSMYEMADRLLARARLVYPRSNLVFHNSAKCASGLHDHNRAVEYARLAVALAPDQIDHRSVLIRVTALSGRYGLARDIVRAAPASTARDLEYLIQLGQFVDYCEAFPLAEAKSALAYLHDTGSFCEATAVASIVFSAIDQNRPFSMIRLGDGEGSWLKMSTYDECRFPSMYRANRTSFLEDWFGSDDLISDDGFLQFGGTLQATYKGHDLIGIPPLARLDLEESYISVRGISAAMNTFRFLNILKSPNTGLRFCSNSVNMALNFDTTFFAELFRKVTRIGVITSQPGLARMLSERGIEVVRFDLIPGDSRNFHVGSDGKPECQYPSYVNRVNAELSAMNLEGIVFLVAGGYVGKTYLQTIRQQGGIAIDIGAVADHWIHHGLPN
jgi:hypothetical protein